MRDEEVRPPESSQLRERAHLSLVPPSTTPPLGAERKDELSVKILAPVLLYLKEQCEPAALTRVAAVVGLGEDDLRQPSNWISLRQFEGVLAATRQELGSEQAFRDACTYKIVQLYGALGVLLRATSVGQALRIMERTGGLTSRVSRFELADLTRNSCRFRYIAMREEQRLTCISRQEQLKALPLLWGLPRARLEEEACVAHGDPACIYALRWNEAARLGRPLLGLLGGLLLAWMVSLWNSAVPTFVSLSALGLMTGLATELRRTNRLNLRFAEENHRALENLAEETAHAMKHLVEMHGRAQEWNDVLEQRILERQQALDTMLQRATELKETRNATVLSLSHDMKTPLGVLRANNTALRAMVPSDVDLFDALADNDFALDKAEALLHGLLNVTKADGGLFQVRPQKLDLRPLVDRIRGTLQALVIKRGIRVSVFTTSTAPENIVTDTYLFNRIVDNILTNAAKYTAKGSILVELDGTPNGLCMRVSDTGRGIASERLTKVFTAQQADPDPLVGDSHGVGLSIVIRLLDQLSGRLEVDSRPGVGTTFWIHLPLALQQEQVEAKQQQSDPLDQILARVVTIRRSANDS
jgi:signal transduction histidine kinase